MLSFCVRSLWIKVIQGYIKIRINISVVTLCHRRWKIHINNLEHTYILQRITNNFIGVDLTKKLLLGFVVCPMIEIIGKLKFEGAWDQWTLGMSYLTNSFTTTQVKPISLKYWSNKHSKPYQLSAFTLNCKSIHGGSVCQKSGCGVEEFYPSVIKYSSKYSHLP